MIQQPQVALHTSSPNVSTSAYFKASTDSSHISPSTSQFHLTKSFAEQQVPEEKRGGFSPSWKGIAADAACSDADAHGWECPNGRSAGVRDGQSLCTHPPACLGSAAHAFMAPEPTFVPFPYIVPWVPQTLQSKFCSQMAGMWDGLVPWNRSRSSTRFDLLSFFICSFCLRTKKIKIKNDMLPQFKQGQFPNSTPPTFGS